MKKLASLILASLLLSPSAALPASPPTNTDMV